MRSRTSPAYNGGVPNSTGNEKAIEIFNPTTSAVNLSACSIRRYSSGVPVGSPLMEEGRLMRATGADVLNSQNTHMVANPDAALEDITCAANRFSAPRQNTPASTTTSKSVIQVGGTVWFNGGTGTGTGGTINASGQLYSRLGEHFDYTGPTGVYQSTITGTLEKFNANISVYPNPARGTATVEIKDAKVGSVLVINDLGQRISAEAEGQGQEKLLLAALSLKAGVYFVQILSADGQTKIQKELVIQ